MDPNTMIRTWAFVSVLALMGGGCGHSVKVASEVPDLSDRGDGVVAIATSHENSATAVTLCSGALVAPNLVLTARHCVSKAITTTPSCDAAGRSHNGAHFGSDADPSQISIYVGTSVKIDSDPPRAHAKRVFHPNGKILCDADVAYIVLDRPIVSARVLPVRLHEPVHSGDIVQPVGFGGGILNQIGERKPRRKSEILAVGPASNARTGAVIGPREFEVEAATCRGDSGGPAIDARTGEIVGVISRGGSCIEKGNHVYTRVDAYKRLAYFSFLAAEQALFSEVAENTAVAPREEF